MMEPIPTVLMLPPHGESESEHWVAAGRLAAARDLLVRLQQAGLYAPIYTVVAEEQDAEILVSDGAHRHIFRQQEFHFGRVLAELCEINSLDRLAYFGGASAPLLPAPNLIELGERLQRKDGPRAIVNNLYSTDWFLTNAVSPIHGYSERLPVDNPFGWIYATEVGIDVMSEEPSASTRADLDTPTDFAMLIGHPHVGDHLNAFLCSIPENLLTRLNQIRNILQTPASRLTIMGRLSSELWRTIELRTQIWIRVLSEERGMVASQRVERGEVSSLLSPLLRQLSPTGFIAYLEQIADAVLWDSRVWIAAEVGWPDAGERFAFDLGDLGGIRHPLLHELTSALQGATIPILVGGYGVVSGGLYALLETLGEQ
jgi:hypothetical protein